MDAFLDKLKNKKLTLVGYGISNKSLGEYFLKNGISYTVRDKKEVDLPKGIKGFFAEDYLKIDEDIIFRAPAVHPSLFPKEKQILTEISYSLEISNGTKIGITGSDGKTTTSTMIYNMLKREHSAHLVGNIGQPLISKVDELRMGDFIVCELSSFQLYDYTPSLDVSVITGISPNHLDWHSSMADYVFSKRNILKKTRKAVVNFDFSYREFFAHSNITYYSLSDLSGLVGNGASYTYIKDGYVYNNDRRLFPLDYIKIKGRYNILNTLGALSATLDYVSLDSIIEEIKDFKGVSHRSEAVCEIEGITFIDSSIDSTPTRTKNTLSAYKQDKSVVIMGGYDKNLSYDILEESLKGTKLVILLGENREKIYKAIKSSPQKIIIVNDILEATNIAYKEAKDGDFVILSPASASFDMFANYKERAEKFKEAIRGLENGKNKENFKRLIK